MKEFDPEKPLVLGIAGRSGVGKSALADVLAPRARISDLNAEKIRWTHLFYAMPLYELASIRRTVQGTAAKDRQKYQVHALLTDVFGSSPLFGAPPYSKLVEMVEEIVSLPFPTDGSKPKEFMQKAGTDIVRAWDENAWVNWMRNKITKEFLAFRSENPTPDYADEDEEEVIGKEKLFGVVVSDVRFGNEAKLITEQPNGILIKLEADDEELAERQSKRDGRTLTPEMLKHPSEGLAEIPEEWYDLVVDNTNLSIKETVEVVVELLESFTGTPLYEKQQA